MNHLRHLEAGRMAFTEHELHRLQAKAAETGLNMSEYLNHLVRTVLEDSSAERSGARREQAS